jgi:hypothetical protein
LRVIGGARESVSISFAASTAVEERIFPATWYSSTLLTTAGSEVSPTGAAELIFWAMPSSALFSSVKVTPRSRAVDMKAPSVGAKTVSLADLSDSSGCRLARITRCAKISKLDELVSKEPPLPSEVDARTVARIVLLPDCRTEGAGSADEDAARRVSASATSAWSLTMAVSEVETTEDVNTLVRSGDDLTVKSFRCECVKITGFSIRRRVFKLGTLVMVVALKLKHYSCLPCDVRIAALEFIATARNLWFRR